MEKWKEIICILFLVVWVCCFNPPFGLAGSAVKLFDTIGVPRGIKIADDGSQDVNLQDQTTATIILPMVQELVETTLTSNTVYGAYSLSVTSAIGIEINQHIRIINSVANSTNWKFRINCSR